jgi:hypothetical protein
MSTEPDLAADAPTLQIGPRQQAAGDPDPAMLLGLVLALVPVHVAGPDPAGQARVSCGNTIGGVEMDTVAGGLGEPDQATRVAYVDMCERAVSERQNVSWTMFFGGLLVVLWLGVVRQRKPGEPGEPGLTR